MKIFKNNRHPELTERPITLQINSSSAKYLAQLPYLLNGLNEVIKR